MTGILAGCGGQAAGCGPQAPPPEWLQSLQLFALVFIGLGVLIAAIFFAWWCWKGID